MRARHMKLLADKAEQRALEGEFQSSLLFIFTIVTIIFTPMSFIASLYAIPSAEFPQQDGNTSWSITRISVGMVVSQAVIMLPIFFWIFSKNKSQIKKQMSALHKAVFTPPKLESVDTSEAASEKEGGGRGLRMWARQNTANTAKTLLPSNAKHLQTLLVRKRTAHLDASSGV